MTIAGLSADCGIGRYKLESGRRSLAILILGVHGV